jgi:hypothetical protein
LSTVFGLPESHKKECKKVPENPTLDDKEVTKRNSVPVNPQGTHYFAFLFPLVRFTGSCNDELGNREVSIFLKSGLFSRQSSYSEPIGREATKTLFRPRLVIWMELHPCLP